VIDPVAVDLAAVQPKRRARHSRVGLVFAVLLANVFGRLRPPNAGVHHFAARACIITSTPGTIWVSHDSGAGILLIHVLDLVDEQDWTDSIKPRYEQPLM
jgi:hypothetical protein